MVYQYKYPRPALTVDCVVFAWDEQELKVLLIQRANEPFAGQWAFPGGFVDLGESPDEAARRELFEETCVKNASLEQLYVFGDPDRDPREHTVSIAYFALVNLSDCNIQAGDDASNAAWFAVDNLPKLAFDHGKIFEMAYERLKIKHGLNFGDRSCGGEK